MKYLSIALPLLGAILIGGSAIAGEGHHMGKGMMDGDKESYRMMFKEKHQMNMDMMNMLRETMTILKGLNHKPSAAEKERLGKMIDEIDDMIASHKEMAKKAREMHEQRKEQWEKQHKMMDKE